MAIVRCANHEPIGRTKTYAGAVEPVGYPETAVVCGLKQCDKPGLVWLDQDEIDAYERGERVFFMPTFAAKLRVK